MTSQYPWECPTLTTQLRACAWAEKELLARKPQYILPQEFQTKDRPFKPPSNWWARNAPPGSTYHIKSDSIELADGSIIAATEVQKAQDRDQFWRELHRHRLQRQYADHAAQNAHAAAIAARILNSADQAVARQRYESTKVALANEMTTDIVPLREQEFTSAVVYPDDRTKDFIVKGTGQRVRMRIHREAPRAVPRWRVKRRTEDREHGPVGAHPDVGYNLYTDLFECRACGAGASRKNDLKGTMCGPRLEMEDGR